MSEIYYPAPVNFRKNLGIISTRWCRNYNFTIQYPMLGISWERI